jgi:hypothetical protein
MNYGGEGKDAYKTYDRLGAEWPNLDAAASALHELVTWSLNSAT